MDLQLQGKHALVTGSTSGIGAGIAKALAKEGVYVAVNGRKEERAQQVVEEIEAEGGKAVLAIGDLGSNEGAYAVVDAAIEKLGVVDILVNNAGKFDNLSFLDIPPQGWLDIYNINMVSMVRVTKRLTSHLKERGWGRVINISSRGGTMSNNSMPHYAATKAACLNFTLALAHEFTNTGVTANAISPGEVKTPELRRFFAEALGKSANEISWEEIEEHGRKEWKSNIVGRYGNPEDIANVVTFIASPLADWISGQNFHVDGGSTQNIY